MSRRSHTVVTILLLLAWLPYVSVRCIDNPGKHSGCLILAAPVQTEPSIHDHASHEHHGERTPAHSKGFSCCDLTGKCEVVASASSQHAMPVVLTTTPLAAELPSPHLSIEARAASIENAHGPPRYLRFATLLI
jgi:hypothetical protein